MVTAKVKIILFFTILIFDKCHSIARNYYKYSETPRFDQYQKAKPPQDNIKPVNAPPKSNPGKLGSGTLSNSPYIPLVETFESPSEGIIDSTLAQYMVRVFTKCLENDYNQTKSNGVIIARNAVAVPASIVLGQDYVYVCTRKEDETTCPDAYDAEEDTCHVPDQVYIHEDFVSNSLGDVFCDNIALLKWEFDIFKPHQVLSLNTTTCVHESTVKDHNVTVIGCFSDEPSELEYATHQIQSKTVGTNAYGAKYSKCPLLYVTKNDETEPNYAGLVMVLKHSGTNDTFNPNVENSGVLYGLGSFTRKNASEPSGFTELCQYDIFFDYPEIFGVLLSKANEELASFSDGTKLDLIKTFSIDQTYDSCFKRKLAKSLLKTFGSGETTNQECTTTP